MADLEKIYRQNADIVLRFLIAKTGSLDLAEELTQETFYQAVKSIDRYDGTCRISTWLCGIAKNVLLTYQRKSRSVPLPLEEYADLAVASAEDEVIRRADTKILLEKIKDLPETSREILQLRIMGGLSFKEIGEIQGHTETWVRVNYYRIKQTIAKEMTQYEE
ncbi:MAG: sigma-70 family RNA polymerase sigma factor [Firmicutes bacterium]|nr:sigma-70 family RNA polymerase sigma factor [Bacillota bacterium]